MDGRRGSKGSRPGSRRSLSNGGRIRKGASATGRVRRFQKQPFPDIGRGSVGRCRPSTDCPRRSIRRRRPSTCLPTLAGPRQWVRGVVAHPQISAAVIAGIVIASFALSRNSVERLSNVLGGASTDSTRLVILPFAGTDKTTHNMAAQTSEALYEAFRSWDGLNLVPDLQVNEAVSRNSRGPGDVQ